jgi:hypothetical protein
MAVLQGGPTTLSRPLRIDPRTRKLVAGSPPNRSAQLRTGIAVQHRPPGTPVVRGVGGQLGGQRWDADLAPRHGLTSNHASRGRRVGRRAATAIAPRCQHEHTQVPPVAAHGQAASPGAGDSHVMAGWELSCRHEGFAVFCRSWAVGRRSTDYVAGALKRPNRIMAGSWVGLHDRRVGPARSRVTASIVAVTPSSFVAGRTPGPIRARYRIWVRRTKGMRRGSPTQRQGRT